MNSNTIKQLNQLNQQFYQTIAPDFSDSRQYFWAGWQQLGQELPLKNWANKTIRVLDLGCGNGRFAEFLAQTYPQLKFEYSGIDNNDFLLNQAQKKLHQLKKPHQLLKLDLVESLINNKLNSQLKSTKFELIVAFGLFHHLPSFTLRKKLIKVMAKLLSAKGLTVFTAWQFLNEPRFKHKLVKPTKLGLDPEQFEPNDFILDWQRGKTAYRYCHYLDQQEINQLVTTSGLKLIRQFQADGKSKQLNLYLILSNKTTLKND
ncbi:MAG: methyltransferase domain-containing protein [Candidatus Pacebacteria bacterium]|nr:methyltransferase domain-containing protein [Candidatus Paceibacterota bacterium]